MAENTNPFLSDLKVTALDGTTIPTEGIFKEIIAPIIYTRTKDLALVDLALKLYNGDSVEVTSDTVKKIKEIFSEDVGIAAFVRKAILDALDKELDILG